MLTGYMYIEYRVVNLVIHHQVKGSELLTMYGGLIVNSFDFIIIHSSYEDLHSF